MTDLKPCQEVKTKTCAKCKVALPFDRFHADRCGRLGRASQCKDCRRRECFEKGYRRTDSYRAYRRKLKQRTRTQDNVKERDRRHEAVYRAKYPHKARAKHMVADAIMRGDLVRPDQCSACKAIPPKAVDGRPLIQAHHHNGYENPLDVIWLCVFCHAKEHRAHSKRIGGNTK